MGASICTNTICTSYRPLLMWPACGQAENSNPSTKPFEFADNLSRRMPECNHYTRSLYCPNGDECLYLHIDPTTKLSPCPHYEKGFCPLGSRCSKKHVRKMLCRFYLAGFCPYGPRCQEGEHVRWPTTELPPPTVRVERSAEELERERNRIREEGEKEEEREWERREGNRRDGRGRGGKGRYGPRRRGYDR